MSLNEGSIVVIAKGELVSLSHLFMNFPQFAVIYTVKGFSVPNEAELNVFSGIL